MSLTQKSGIKCRFAKGSQQNEKQDVTTFMKDMRDFIAKGEKEGLCKRITAEVDWNLELSHIAKLNEEQSGPALLFENIKDYNSPLITSVCKIGRASCRERV